jgi:hypothetical protein
MICGVIIILPLGTIQIGETGVLLWTSFGLLMAQAQVAAHGSQAMKASS